MVSVLANSDGQGLVALRTPEGHVTTIPLDQVKSVRGNRGFNLFRVAIPAVVTRSLTLSYAGAGGCAVLSYLRNNVTWTVAYRWDIVDEEQVLISCIATVVNDTDEGGLMTNLDCVIGFPKFTRLGHACDPLISTLEATAFAKQQEGSRAQRQRPQYCEPEPDYQAPAEGAAAGGAEPEVETEDISFHMFTDIIVPPRQRVQLPVYTSQPSSYTVHYKASNCNPSHPETDGRNQIGVWTHMCVKNTTGKPWSQGPVVLRRDARVMGQSSHLHTPHGVDAVCEVAKALSVNIKHVRTIANTTTVRQGEYSTTTTTHAVTKIYIVSRKKEDISLKLEFLAANRGKMLERYAYGDTIVETDPRPAQPQPLLRPGLCRAHS